MNKRLDYLDSIRGIAALIVVISHIFKRFVEHNDVNYPLLTFLFESLDLGRVGVIVFFIASGFVIPWSLKHDYPHALKAFAIKRFFRLYPAYWLSIIAAVVIGIDNEVISIERILFNLTMIQKVFGSDSIIGVYWTLFIELIFYVICACLFYFRLLHKNKCLIISLVLFSLGAVGSSVLTYYYHIRIPLMLPQGLAVMFYGSLLCNYFIKKQVELKKPLIILTIFYFMSLFIAQNIYYSDNWLIFFSSHLIAFFVFFLLITKVKLHNSLAVYLGRISYSWYLLHILIVKAVFSLFGDFAFTTLGFYLVIATVLIGSILIADISYRLIEKPGVRIAIKVVNYFGFNRNKVTT